MVSDFKWCVLVEDDREDSEYVEGGSVTTHHWVLVKDDETPDEATAREQAEELARTYVPRRRSSSKVTGRRIYRLPDGSWLVKVEFEFRASQRAHVRVSVAELVHAEKAERPPAAPAPAPEPGLLKRAFRRG